MAGIIKRPNSNIWYATYLNTEGKEQRKSTGIEIEPKEVSGARNVHAAKKENEAKARIIAAELEKEARGDTLDLEKLKILAGNKVAAKILKSNRLPSCAQYLTKWQSGRNVANPKNDKKAIKQFLAFLGGGSNSTIDKINRQTAINFMNHEHDRVKWSTVNVYLECLRTSFQAAVNEKLIKENPFARVRLAEGETQVRDNFTIDQIKLMVNNFPGEWPDIIRVCIYTGGQRLGDVTTLRWDQIDFTLDRISLTTQKRHKTMHKPMIPPLKEVLLRRWKEHNNACVFPVAAVNYSVAGNRSSKNSIEFGKLLKKFGLTSGPIKGKGDRRNLANLSFHSLRATAVTILHTAGISMEMSMLLVGHDNKDVHRVYLRPTQGQLVKAVSPSSIDL